MPNTENAKNVTLQTVIKLRRAAFADDCILALGEPGYHTTTKEFKIGDGATTWKDLPFANKTQIEALIAAGVQEAKDYADGKVASVDKKTGTAITVDNNDPKNPKVGLDLNNTGNVVLSQTDAGLSANIDLSGYELTDTTYTFADGTTDGTFVVTPEGGEAKTVKIGGMTAAEALEEAKKYADANDANDNTSHNHIDGKGIKASGGGIDGDAKLDLNIAFDFIKSDEKITKVVLYDKDDASKTEIASFETSAFIKDGMLHDVEYDPVTNKLFFTWNTDAGTKADEVLLSDILDPYVFTEGALIDITVDGTKVSIAHKTVAAPTESDGTGRKYLTGVTTDGYGHITGFTTATEVDQDLSDYKTKQKAYSEEGSNKQTITSVTQTENGDLTVTYGDIDFSHNHDDAYKVIQVPVEDADAATDTVDVNQSKFSYVKSITQDEQGVITVTKEEMPMPALSLNGDSHMGGDGDVQVDLDIAGDYSSYSIKHRTYQTGTVKDTTHDSATDPSFITGIEINNGHVTGATVQNLATVLENMIFVLDGGESASTLVIN